MAVITTPRGFLLGKNDPVIPEGIEFKTQFETASPPPPLQAHYGHAVTAPWNLDGNGPDPLITVPGVPANWSGCGNCVECAKAHALLTGNYNELGIAPFPDPNPNDVVLQYCAEVGCTPEELFGNPDQYDTGLDIPSSLSYWYKNPQFGTTLPWYATIDYSSQTDLKNGIYLAGGIQVGVQIRANNEQQFPLTWTWDPSSQVLGGHSVWVTGYSSTLVWLVSWGQLIAATWEWLLNTIDEAYAYGSPQANAAGKSVTGLLIPALQTKLDVLATAA